MTRSVYNVTVHRMPHMGITAMEIESNHSFPRHSHDEFGIGVVLSGGQRSWSGVGTVVSVPGDVITVNAGEMHDGHPVDGAARRWRIMYFDPNTDARRLLSETQSPIEFISPSLTDRRLSRCVTQLFDCLLTNADAIQIEEIVAPLMRRVVGLHNVAERARHWYSVPVAKARERIDDDPSRSITLSDLVELTGLSRYQIVRAFSRELGITPYAYVLQRRVRLARELLLRGEPLSMAAVSSGFADQSHMTREFSRHFGVSPGRYLAGRR